MVDPSLVDATERTIGGSLRCGPLGFGCWRFTHADTGDAQRVLEAALDAGLTLVDTADVYGLDWGGAGFGSVEERLGDVLRVAPHLRERMALATKGGIRPPVPYDSSAPALRAACEASLRRLGVERIDLYQVHRPDLFTHPGEVADTLAALVAEGKVAEVGVSNHTPAQHEALAAALADRGVRLAAAQVEYSAAHLDPLRDGRSTSPCASVPPCWRGVRWAAVDSPTTRRGYPLVRPPISSPPSTTSPGATTRPAPPWRWRSSSPIRPDPSCWWDPRTPLASPPPPRRWPCH